MNYIGQVFYNLPDLYFNKLKRIPNVNLYRNFKMVNIISKKQFLNMILGT